jgi:hypothetical protein
MPGIGRFVKVASNAQALGSARLRFASIHELPIRSVLGNTLHPVASLCVRTGDVRVVDLLPLAALSF